MSSPSRLPILVSCLVIVCLACLESVFAQVPGVPGIGGRSGGRGRQPQRPQPQQQLQNLPPLQTTGVVDAVVPGYIRILSAQNQLLVLQVLPTAKCQLTGKAKPEALGPGCYIRFVAEVNKRRGTVDEKITALTVFTPSTLRQPGAEPDSGMGTSFGPRPGADKKKGEEKAKPAFGAAAAAGADTGKPAAGARKAGGAAAKGAVSEVFDVRGQVTRIANGKVELHVPNAYFRPLLKVEIADDADIDVEVDDPTAYTLARKGDKVEAQGRLAIGGDRGFAEELIITMNEPLGNLQDAKKHKGARSKRGAEADEPAEAKSGEGKGDKKDADASPKAKKTEAKKSTEPDDAEKATDTPESKPKKKAAKKKAEADAEAEK